VVAATCEQLPPLCMLSEYPAYREFQEALVKITGNSSIVAMRWKKLRKHEKKSQKEFLVFGSWI
jgi:hypothetical protein